MQLGDGSERVPDDVGRHVVPGGDDRLARRSPVGQDGQCDEEDLTSALEELRALQTPALDLIVGNNAAETWHSTNNGVNFFYDDAIVGMLHAARQINVTVCVVSPNSISVPTFPGGQTPGVSISDALAACGLPP